MPNSDVGMCDLSLRCLQRLDPPTLGSSSNIASALELLDAVGFRSVEAWGDMTFAHCLGALQENPWDRLSKLAAHLKRTPLQMTLRGRCLLGARPYPERVVKSFVAQAAQCGIHSFCVYEPLNDRAGLEFLAEAVREIGARLTLGVVYGASAGANIEELCAEVHSLAELGPAAFCLKSAEAVPPSVVTKVVQSLVAVSSVPVELELDNLGTLGVCAAMAGVQGGATALHGSAAPVWLDPAAVPLASLTLLLRDAGYEPEVDFAALAAFAAGLGRLFGRDGSGRPGRMSTTSLVDWSAVDWQDLVKVPAKLLVEIDERLRSVGAPERLPEVVSELIRVREEMGDPPLVSPLGEVAATQAVLNVLYAKRWQMVPDEMKAYLRGTYGSPPKRPLLEVARESEKEPETNAGQQAEGAGGHSGELAGESGLEPSEEEALPGDALLLALAPEAAQTFFAKRQTAADVASLFAPTGTIVTSDMRDQWQDLTPEAVSTLISLFEASTIDELTLENQGTRISLRKGGAPAALEPGSAGAPALGGQGEVTATSPAPPDSGELTVTASMVGTFYRSPAPGAAPYVEVGSHVSEGDVLCVLEAMKLMNELVSEVAGEIVAILVEDGMPVEYGQPLFRIRVEAE